jgi:Arc/MetJ family transcription regulator
VESVGPVVPPTARKTRITIRIDDDLLDWFRQQVDEAGGGNYQTMINAALRAYVGTKQEPLEDVVRRVVKEELRKTKPKRQPKSRKAA